MTWGDAERNGKPWKKKKNNWEKREKKPKMLSRWPFYTKESSFSFSEGFEAERKRKDLFVVIYGTYSIRGVLGFNSRQSFLIFLLDHKEAAEFSAFEG